MLRTQVRTIDQYQLDGVSLLSLNSLTSPAVRAFPTPQRIGWARIRQTWGMDGLTTVSETETAAPSETDVVPSETATEDYEMVDMENPEQEIWEALTSGQLTDTRLFSSETLAQVKQYQASQLEASQQAASSQMPTMPPQMPTRDSWQQQRQ